MRRGLLTLALIAAACGSNAGPAPTAVDASGDAAPDGGPAHDCPMGQIPGPDGACMPVGIQGCADIFIDPENGLCKPSMDHCPKGQIPIFTEGCQSVGIPDCHAMFINPESGLCAPSMDHCPPGQIPNFQEGCQPVGIPDCHPDFIHSETGLCFPNADSCDEGFIAVPTQGCVSLDPPGGCGEGAWGNVDELPGDVHVDPSYGAGDSDGTRDKPWPLIAYALGDVDAGGRVVLAAGDYDEGVLLAKPVAIVGRCSSMVTISGSRTGSFGATVFEAKGPIDVAVSDVKIAGTGIGFAVHSGARTQLTRVILDGNKGGGLLTAHAGTAVTATDILIARTQTEGNGTFGRAIEVYKGALVTMERGAVLENHEVAIGIFNPGSSLDATDVLVAGNVASPAGMSGAAFAMDDGAGISLERVAIVGNDETGIAATGAGTSVSCIDSVVARTRALPGGERGYGIHAQHGATVTLDGVALVENRRAGMLIYHAGTTVGVAGSLIARTEPSILGSGGRGIGISDGAHLVLEHSVISDHSEVGLLVVDAGTLVNASDLLLERTELLTKITDTRGVQVSHGASLELVRAAVMENRGTGLLVGIEGTWLGVYDSIIARSQPLPDGRFGTGIVAQLGAVLDIETTAFRENHEVAVLIDGASGTVTRCLLLDTRVSEANGYGDGLLVADGSDVTTREVVVSGNDRAGILYNDSTGEVRACLGTDNGFGLVVQGSQLPLVSEDSLFAENQQDTLSNGNLTVPNQIMAIPPPPEVD